MARNWDVVVIGGGNAALVSALQSPQSARIPVRSRPHCVVVRTPRRSTTLSTGTLTRADHGMPGAILLAHLASIVMCFTITPDTKFIHGPYRLLAIYQDEWERAS